MYAYTPVVPISFSEVAFQAVSRLTCVELSGEAIPNALTLHIREALDELTARRRPPRETEITLDIFSIDLTQLNIITQVHDETHVVRIEPHGESIILFSTNPLISD